MIEWLCLVIFLALATIIFSGVLWMIAGDLSGAPFVPSDEKFLKKIFMEAKFVPGKKFLDIGSGDGRVARLAAEKYRLEAIGIELQPFLVWYSQLASWKSRNGSTVFIRRNFFCGKLPEADYIYFYLLPGTVEKLGNKITSECKSGTLVISRAFEVKTLRDRLIKIVEEKGRRAYFYRV